MPMKYWNKKLTYDKRVEKKNRIHANYLESDYICQPKLKKTFKPKLGVKLFQKKKGIKGLVKKAPPYEITNRMRRSNYDHLIHD